MERLPDLTPEQRALFVEWLSAYASLVYSDRHDDRVLQRAIEAIEHSPAWMTSSPTAPRAT